MKMESIGGRPREKSEIPQRPVTIDDAKAIIARYTDIPLETAPEDVKGILEEANAILKFAEKAGGRNEIRDRIERRGETLH